MWLPPKRTVLSACTTRSYLKQNSRSGCRSVPGPPGWLGFGRRHREAGIELADEDGQELVGFGQGLNASQPQLGHQAILKRAPRALHAPLGLWTERADRADA